MWVPGVTGWLSSLGRLLTQPFADIPVLAADLCFVPTRAVSARKPQCEGQEEAWDRSRTTCAPVISPGFGVTVPNGSTLVVSEPPVILQGVSESSGGVWVGEGKGCREEDGCLWPRGRHSLPISLFSVFPASLAAPRAAHQAAELLRQHLQPQQHHQPLQHRQQQGR